MLKLGNVEQQEHQQVASQWLLSGTRFLLFAKQIPLLFQSFLEFLNGHNRALHSSTGLRG